MCIKDKPITCELVIHGPSTEYEQPVVTDATEDRLVALFNLPSYKDLLPLCLIIGRKSKNFDMTTLGLNLEATIDVEF